MSKYPLHFFNIEIAQIYGLKQSIILTHLAYLAKKNNNIFIVNVKEIHERLSYIRCGEIESIITEFFSKGLLILNEKVEEGRICALNLEIQKFFIDQELTEREKTLKQDFIEINEALIFSDDFYKKAWSFMVLQNLETYYLQWIYAFCYSKAKNKNYQSLIFTLFCKPDVLAKYRDYRAQFHICPICRELVRKDSVESCSNCQWTYGDDEKTIDKKKKFFLSTPKEREEITDSEFNYFLETTKEQFPKNKKSFGKKEEMEI